MNRFLVSLALAVLGFSSCTSKTVPEPPNTLHLSSPAKIKGFDPALSDDLYSALALSRVYESLYQYHYLKRPYVLIPNLAESMPEISKDGKTYTIHLKKGVLFQDDPCFKATQGKGRELTADDVVYSYLRLADPKLLSTGFWIFDGRIAGINAWRDAASKSGAADYSKPPEGLKAVDRYTLRIQLLQKSALFNYFLAMPPAAIIPHEAVEYYGKEFMNHAVGTGPFRLAEFTPARAIYVKNPTYRHEVYPSEGSPGDKEAGLLEDAGKPLPLADRIVETVFTERQPEYLTFMSGKLDVSEIPKDMYGQAVTPSKDLAPDLKAKGIRLIKATRLDTTHESFNMADPILGKNKYLRQALSLAYNGDAMIELFYNGRALPAQGPIPPGVNGYDPDFKNPYRQYNVAKAKELLAKAGYPEGRGLPPIEYLTLADSTMRQFTEYLTKSFAALGVKVVANQYSWPEFTEKLKNRKGQMWGYAWGGDYPDAENFLQLFYSKNASPGPNDSNYSNPEYDRMYEKSLTMPDGPARTALYKQMTRVLAEDCPWIFVAHRQAWGLVQPWLKNYKYMEFEHSKAKYLRVDPALKK